MSGYKVIGTLGAIVMTIGVFMPARVNGFGGYVSYFTDQRNPTLMLIALGVVAVALLYSGQFGRMLLVSLIIIVGINWLFVNRGPGMLGLERSFVQITDEITQIDAVRQVTGLLRIREAWYVMLLGGSLLLIASMLAPKER
ncbi:MAG: hypothetical protein IPK16_02745 [Anaerolineales bacterium]|nr:hypothetical protein [Anaerolineales bacterium]